jgi:ATP-dependent RNA helicase RhlB
LSDTSDTKEATHAGPDAETSAESSAETGPEVAQSTAIEAATGPDGTPEPEAEEPIKLHKFEEFVLPEPLLRAIRDLGFEQCTPIQSVALPSSLADYDITGQAQTGTGKTAAFLITILTRLWEEPEAEPLPLGTPRALILAPTRELALQIESDALELAKYMDIGVLAVVGGMDFQKQLDRIESKPIHILVGTPGRLLDFVSRRKVKLGKAEVLVIDEADRMLDMGFIPDVRRIVYQTPHKRARQTLFFSATFNDDVMRLARSWTLAPEHVSIMPETVATESVAQSFWLVSADRKAPLLAEFFEKHKPERALVFTNRRDQCHQLQKYLSRKEIRCEVLAGDVPQKKRISTLQRFKDGAIPFVIATDVAGRGIHVDGISHVINFDLPEDPEDYVHRIGRTGRAGAEGISISFVSEDDAFNLPAIEEYLGSAVVCQQPDL